MLGRGRGRPPHPDVLTPAEQRVLEELRKGGTNSEIAVRLGRSPETVRTHIASMLAKLDLTDRHELAAWRQDGGRKRLLGFLAIRPALGSVGRPLVWVGAAAGGITGAAVVVVLLVIFLGEAEDERVGATGEMTGAPVTASDMRSAMPGAGTIGTGDSHTCALRDTGEVVCWGSNDKGQADAPAGKFRWLSAGQDRTCAVAESGEVRCWGDTEFVRCQPSEPGSDVIFCRKVHVSVSGVVGVAYRSVSVSDTVAISGLSDARSSSQPRSSGITHVTVVSPTYADCAVVSWTAWESSTRSRCRSRSRSTACLHRTRAFLAAPMTWPYRSGS